MLGVVLLVVVGEVTTFILYLLAWSDHFRGVFKSCQIYLYPTKPHVAYPEVCSRVARFFTYASQVTFQETWSEHTSGIVTLEQHIYSDFTHFEKLRKKCETTCTYVGPKKTISTTWALAGPWPGHPHLHPVPVQRRLERTAQVGKIRSHFLEKQLN